MSDPNEPRVATPAEAPPAPPAGETARRDLLASHFRLHDGRYTRLALEQAARSAGYSDNDIAAAWSLIDMDDAGKAPAARSARIARIVILVLYLATFAVFVVGSNMPAMTYGVGVPILAVTLLIVGGISLLIVGRRKVVSRNPAAALTSLLALPFILLFIVAGLCVATTAPSFFGAPPFQGPATAPPEVPPNDGPAPAPAESPPAEAS
jgi:uncharacterized membrane protein SirB2